MASLIDTLPTGLFVGNAFGGAGDGRTFSVTDPASEAVIAEVADAGPADAIGALGIAVDAQSSWAATAPRRRSEVLAETFRLLTERSDDFAALIVAESGKALKDARFEVAYAAEYFRWFAEETVRNRGELSIAPSGQNRIIVTHQPIGVALLITPWNFPAAMLARKIAPALAAGCAVLCKPAEDTPLTALALGQLLAEAGLPAGVVNVVPTSRPAPVSDALLADGRIRKLSFTGSTEVGRMLLAKAADQVISCSMELGGNAPFVVFDDADLDQAVAGALVAKLRNGGEACTAANRFYVAEGLRREFANRLAIAMAGMKMGPGMDDGVEVGPLINADALAKVSGLVEDALQSGAKLLTGGDPGRRPGFFYAPTVLDEVPEDATILGDEIFGPVAPIVGFSSEDEVIERANATEFGLVSFIYTRDLARGLRVAERLEAGMIGLNRGLVSDPAAPFGGTKHSGLGREGGRQGIEEYLEPKYIAVSW